MFSFKTITIFLAGYLVLFLNFGPSYHSAIIGHGSCCSAVDAHSDHVGCGCQGPSEKTSDNEPESYVGA